MSEQHPVGVDFDFSGTVSIVTGSGGGIGQAYVEAIAAKRHRNVEWAAAAVRDSAAMPPLVAL